MMIKYLVTADVLDANLARLTGVLGAYQEVAARSADAAILRALPTLRAFVADLGPCPLGVSAAMLGESGS